MIIICSSIFPASIRAVDCTRHPQPSIAALTKFITERRKHITIGTLQRLRRLLISTPTEAEKLLVLDQVQHQGIHRKGSSLTRMMTLVEPRHIYTCFLDFVCDLHTLLLTICETCCSLAGRDKSKVSFEGWDAGRGKRDSAGRDGTELLFAGLWPFSKRDETRPI